MPQNLRALRRKLRLSQCDLAQSMRISFSTISRWESGISQPDDLQEEQLLTLEQIYGQIPTDALKRQLRILGIDGTIAIAVERGCKIDTPTAASIGALLKGEEGYVKNKGKSRS